MSQPNFGGLPSYATLASGRVSVWSSDAMRKIFAPTSSSTRSASSDFRGRFSPRSTRTSRKLKNAQIDVLKRELTQCCLMHIADSYRVHHSRVKGLQILNILISMTTLTKIGAEFAIHMVWAALSCVHHFLLRLRAENSFMQWFRRKQAKRSIHTFDRLMEFLVPMYYTISFNAVMTFFEEANTWEVDYFCSNLIYRVLDHADQKSRIESINEIIGLIENSTLTNPVSSRQILQVLFDVLDKMEWVWVDDTLLVKFLDMFFCSLTPEHIHDYNYESLEKGLDTCVRAMAPVIDDSQLLFMICWMLEVVAKEKISDENLLTFGSLLEYICNLYTHRKSKRPLTEKILPWILKTIGSRSLLYSLLGHRILHSVIDRCRNKLVFDTPRIFLRNSHYRLVLNRYSPQDKALFQKYREAFHRSAVDAMLMHGAHKLYLEHIYTTIALFTVEIPCAYTAAAGVCVSMALQDAALDSGIQMTQAHRLHATVVSLMSLVCYIHKAAVFYDYVETIVDRRANFAPHLNPPLMLKYKYAQHHVLWNKPDLFFEDWETRYGLWTCFKNKQNIVVVHMEKPSMATSNVSETEK